MVKLNIRLTKDDTPVVVDSFRTSRIKQKRPAISRLTFSQLKQYTESSPSTTLSEVLDLYFGKILLYIEVKTKRTAKAALDIIATKYIKNSSDWDNILISSHHTSTLRAIRKLAPSANLSLVHRQNPFVFVAHTRTLGLSAVGFHRLNVNPLALEIAKKAKLLTYAYTVDRPHAARLLERRGLDAIITNHPSKAAEKLSKPKSGL